MIRRPPRSTLFPTRRSSDLGVGAVRVTRQRPRQAELHVPDLVQPQDRKSTRLNSSHANISYAVFCLKKKNIDIKLLRGKSDVERQVPAAGLLDTDEDVQLAH